MECGADGRLQERSSATVTRGMPGVTRLLGETHERVEERWQKRLQVLTTRLLYAPSDERRRVLELPHVPIDLVEHLRRQFLHGGAVGEDEDRQPRVVSPRRCDQ